MRHSIRISCLTVALAACAAGLSAQGAAPTAAAKPAASVSYKKEIPAALAKKAKVAEPAAAATALATVPGGRITAVELEEEDGAFIYSYDIAVAGKKGVQEVHVDANTGRVIKSEHESESQMSAEKEKEEKAARDAKAKPKKPPTR